MEYQIRAHIAWLSSPEGERVGGVAKRKAWYDFLQKYPHADEQIFRTCNIRHGPHGNC